MGSHLPFHSTLVVRTSPNGEAEYRLEHPGSPRSPSRRVLASPKPAIKQSRIGRRVRFAGTAPQDGADDEDDMTLGNEAAAQWSPQPPQAPGYAISPSRCQPYGHARSQYLAPPQEGQQTHYPAWSNPRTAAAYAPSPPMQPEGIPSCPPQDGIGAAAQNSNYLSPSFQNFAASPGVPYPGPYLQASYGQDGQHRYAHGGWQSNFSQPLGLQQAQLVQQPPSHYASSQPSPAPYPPSGHPAAYEAAPSVVPTQPWQQAAQAYHQQQQQQQPQHVQVTPVAPVPQFATAANMQGQVEDSARLQVTANNVSITVSAGNVEQFGSGAQANQARTERPAPEPAAAAVPRASLAGPPSQGTPVPRAAAAATASEPLAQLPAAEQASSGTQTEVAGPNMPPSEDLQKAGKRRIEPTTALPRLPLPPGIPASVAAETVPSSNQPPRQQHKTQDMQGKACDAKCSAPSSTQQQAQMQQRSTATRKPQPHLSHQPSDAGRSFDGDLSCWGKTHMEDSYYEDGLTSGSLSSGLSPRESRPRHREWDPAEAMQALAQGADIYGKASRQRSHGQGSGPLSAADALPAKLAAQQLSSLAGMSAKVQAAIMHSQRVFERQALAVEQAVLQRAFYAWKNVRDIRALQKQRQQQILRKVQWGVLRRCTQEWLLQAGHETHQKLAVQQVRSILARHCAQRCFKSWAQLCLDRRWKTQLALKDKQLQLLATEVRHIESRPVRYMQRYKIRRSLQAWRVSAVYHYAKKQCWEAACLHDRLHLALKGFLGWQQLTQIEAARRQAAQHASWLVQRLKLQHCCTAWRRSVGSRARNLSLNTAVAGLHSQQVLRRALGGWRYLAWFRQTARDAFRGRQLQHQAIALQGWQQHVEVLRARRSILGEADAARHRRLLDKALYGWRAFVDGRQARALDEDHARLAELTERLQEENAHLKQDVDRLGRVIDSGDWDRERTAELARAAEVLKTERDALLALVQRLQEQQRQQEHSHLRVTTEGISGLESRPLSPNNASPPLSPAARNKLLVKSGSSFNAMVRALKQDLVSSGALSRNPAATYEVDKLSLNRVGLKGDGLLEVEGLASPNLRAVSFGRSRPSSPTKRPESKQGDLLQAALRLQTLGGRSVALGKRML